MSGDIFVNNNDNPFQKAVEDDNNFFLQPENIAMKQKTSEPTRRLNDLDSNILREDAYKEVTDEVFKLEYKISKLEDDLKELDNQIQAAKDIHDFSLVENLYERKKQLKDDLAGLIEIYNDTSLSAKISGGFTNKIKEKVGGVRNIFAKFGDTLVSHLPKKFSSSLEIKKSLSKLENISKNVDELMTLTTPYGEAMDKYEQLSKYIIKANAIQAQIAKSLK